MESSSAYLNTSISSNQIVNLNIAMHIKINFDYLFW